MSSRRNFLLQTTMGVAAATVGPLAAAAAVSSPVKKAMLPIGMAGYTFARFDLDQAIAMMSRVNIKNISVKEIHLPINSSAEKIQEVLGKFSAAGIHVYAVGVIYMKTKQAVDEAFDYAKRVGVPLIVGVPNPELLDYTEEKIKAYNIRLAVHNHGPEDKLYPGPKNAYDLIKTRDERLGLCLDIGHAARAGEEPSKAVLAYKNRIFDLHIKDISAAAKDGKAIELGRGAIDFRKLVLALQKINYAGVCSLEFEKDMSDPLPGIAESAGFFRGVISTVNS